MNRKNVINDLTSMLEGEKTENLREIRAIITYYYGYRSGQCSGNIKFSEIFAEMQEEKLEKVK